MMDPGHAAEVRSFLSKYPFCLQNIDDSDIELFQTAFIHDSYGNHMEIESYERLEFLGDAVIKMILTEFLYRNSNLNEGKMTQIKSLIENNDNFGKCMDVIGADVLRLLKYIGNAPKKAKADVFEAIMGAVYLVKGYEKAQEIVKKSLIEHIRI